jgi:hypothetical protein
MMRLTKRFLSLVAAIGGLLAALGIAGQATAGGYAHAFRWYQPDTVALKVCVADMARVLMAANDKIAGPYGTGSAVIADEKIHFNGRGDEAEEAFLFPGKLDRNECRTMRDPYDAAVTACLLVARDHFPPGLLGIESDGQWSTGDWDRGRRLYQQVLGRQPLNPISETDEVAPDVPPGQFGAANRPEEWTPLPVSLWWGSWWRSFGCLFALIPRSSLLLREAGSIEFAATPLGRF